MVDGLSITFLNNCYKQNEKPYLNHALVRFYSYSLIM